jgi:hypothetical protein
VEAVVHPATCWLFLACAEVMHRVVQLLLVFISLFWGLGVANPSLPSQVHAIETVKSPKRSLR